MLLICLYRFETKQRYVRAKPESNRLSEVLTATCAQGCYSLFARPVIVLCKRPGTIFQSLQSGLSEDSATGSAAGPLACQLRALGLVKDHTTIAIEQGYEMARPSLLRVHLSGDLVRLLGRCVTVAGGLLRVG